MCISKYYTKFFVGVRKKSGFAARAGRGGQKVTALNYSQVNNSLLFFSENVKLKTAAGDSKGAGQQTRNFHFH